MIVPTPASSASPISRASLLLPCMWIRSGGKPACSAANSSPPDATSTDSPSSRTRRSIAWPK